MTRYRTFKGTTAEYRNLHNWVVKQLGKPNLCVECGATKPKVITWANISGEYKKDITDWKRLCMNCHHKMDEWTNSSRKTVCLRGHLFTPENTYVTPSTGIRHCRECKRYLLRIWQAKQKQLTKPRKDGQDE